MNITELEAEVRKIQKQITVTYAKLRRLDAQLFTSAHGRAVAAEIEKCKRSK